MDNTVENIKALRRTDEFGRVQPPIDLQISKAKKAAAFPLSKRPNIAVIFVTCARADMLKRVVSLLRAQTWQPKQIIVSAVENADVIGLNVGDTIELVFGEKGACQQRNRALLALDESIDIVVFFDDDFIPHPRWLESIARCFADRPSVDTITGVVLADGVRQGGISFEDGMKLVNRYAGEHHSFLVEGYSPYGCNMAYRRTSITGLTFDERLVLYGWLEDRDFGAAVASRGGKQIKIGSAVGVHLGVNRGRLSGRRLGYSQVVNALYLHAKGHMTIPQVADHLSRNIVMNSARAFWPEKHIDRKGRLAGNVLGAIDALRGLIAPERAYSL